MIHDLPKKPIRLNPYTVYQGIAAEDLSKDSLTLKVICPELLPQTASGTVAAGIVEGSVKLKDRDGNPITSTYTTSNHIVATWEGQSGLRYPPLVRQGEPVEVYKIGNQDKFYWRETGRGRDFRKTDRVYIEVGASDPSKPGVVKDDTNTYTAYLDSIDKKVGFKTSQANGEVTAFSIEADLTQGTFHLSDNSDDPKNRIFLDTGASSGQPAFHINLNSGATLRLEGDNLFIKIPGKMMIDVGDRIIFNSPLTIFNLNKVGMVIINAANTTINTAKDFIVTAGNVVGLSAVSTKIAGVLNAAAIKSSTIVKGVFGSNYQGVSIRRPEDTPPTLPNNNADTDTSGIPYRTD